MSVFEILTLHNIIIERKIQELFILFIKIFLKKKQHFWRNLLAIKIIKKEGRFANILIP